MAKIQIKSEKLTPFGGIFHVMDLFERHLSHIIDGTLGKRSVSIGYDYSEIILHISEHRRPPFRSIVGHHFGVS